MCLVKRGVAGGLFAIQLLLTIKKGIIPLNFQLNEPFLKFLQRLLPGLPPPPPQKKKILCANIVLY